MKQAGLLSRWTLLCAATRDARLSRTDCATLGAILDRLDNSGVCWPSLNKIAEDAQVSRSSAVRSLVSLTGHGYLLRESGNRTMSNRYRMGTPPRREPAPTGRCEPAPRCEIEPRCEPAPVVGAGLSLRVGADLHPEPASLNLPNEPEELSLAPLAASTEAESQFDRFWKTYPRKIGSKSKTRQSWDRQKLDRMVDRIIDGVQLRVQIDPQWKDAQFIPYPLTFVNNQRWDDEWQVGTLAQRDGESKDDLIARLQVEAEKREVGKMSVADRAAYLAKKGDEREWRQRNGVAANFRDKVYTGTPVEELPPYLQAAVKAEMAKYDDAEDEAA